MGFTKLILRTRCVDLLMMIFCALFMVCLLFVNLYLTSNSTTKNVYSHGLKKMNEPKRTEIQPHAAEGGQRFRREAEGTYTPYTIPADTIPIVLGTPWGTCDTPTILTTDFPNATCFGFCTAASCTGDTINNIDNGNAELVCTAKIIHLGFKRSGAYSVSKWLKEHPRVEAKTGDIFITSSGGANFDWCPVPQLRDTSQSHYFSPYSTASIGQTQDSYYLHCEDCLTAGTTDYYFGSVFLDLPVTMFRYIETTSQRFVVTLKNPTDRVFAEYFYPYITGGYDLDTVGGDVLHAAMSAAIDQATACMDSLGPTPCVHGVGVTGTTTLSETTMLYESCYATRLAQVTQQLEISQMYFLKIEEFHADPVTVITDLYNFVGLEYTGPIAITGGASVQKPINQETIDMVDAFFSSFNTQLVNLLGDSKWQYTRS